MKTIFSYIADRLSGRSFQPRIAVLAAALGAGLLGCSSPEQPAVLARIGDYTVTEAHFQNAFRKFYLQTGQAAPVNDVTKKAVLDNELDRYTVVTWAEEQGWHRDEAGRRQQDLIRRQVLMEEYARLVVHPTVAVDEADLRELFRRYNTRVRASHLYAPSRAAADSLYHRLQAGERFEDLAREVFTNAHLRESGGDLGFFTVDEMDPAFENMAFRMQPGEISPVVRTEQGYSIIKVTQVAQKPIITENEFAQRRGALQDYALQRNREMATRRDLENQTARVAVDEDLLAALAAASSPNAEGVRFAVPVPDTTVLATLDDFRLTVGDFRYEASLLSDTRLEKPSALREVVDGITFRSRAIRQVLAHPAYDANYAEATMQATFHSWLVDRFNAHLEQEVTVAEAELRRMYDSSEEFRRSPLLLNVSELVAISEADAQKALADLRKGVPFRQVLIQYGVVGEALLYEGELGLRPVDSFGKFAMDLKDLRPGDLAGPLEYLPDRWLVYACHERVEAGTQSFEQAKPMLLEVRRTDEVKKRKKTIIDETKKRHNAEADYAKMQTVSITI